MKFLMNSKVPWSHVGLHFTAAILAALWLTGCSSNVSPAAAPLGEGREAFITTPPGSAAKLAASPERAPQKAAEERPGLATGQGEEIESPWNRQSFVRASSRKPAGTGAIYYNNREGIEAMTGYKEKVDGMQRSAGDMIEWGIKGGFGYLSSYQTYGPSRRFVVGSRDSSYSIVLKNRCKSRLEVVLSVDGLDVIDGNTAGFSKRGYVIGSGETLEVKGWRTSPDTVSRFKFSTVAGSYANLAHGEHRNVGVIGLAVFTEQGVDPWTWTPREVDQRMTADPFARKL